MSPGTFLAISAGLLVIGVALRGARWWLTTCIASALAAIAAVLWVLSTGVAWEWRSALRIGGEAVHLRLDGLSGLFFVLVAVIGATGAAYSMDYWKEAQHSVSARRGRAWWNVLLLCMGLLLVCSNGLHFLVAWEGFALAAYFLITLDGRRAEVRSAGWLYLAASHAGTLALFAFFGLLAARTGSWDLGPMRDRAELAPLFWLALFGFGVKAGLFPLHIWLPSAHANAPSHVSAIMSGVAIKMGIYGIIRFSGWLPVPGAAGWMVAVLGAASAVLGVAFALGQHDLKRLLAYHSVENIGIILLGAGFALMAAAQGGAVWGIPVLAGGLLHVWNHGLFKSLLFFGAGSVVHSTGTQEMSRLGGLWRAMPWTASLFTLGAVAISGLPPLNGFVSEWLVYLGLFDAANPPSAVWAALPAIVLLALTGGLALACFVKVCGVVFLGAPRSRVRGQVHECGPWMRGSMLVLALGCVVIGLAPLAVWPAIRAAIGDWQGNGGEFSAPESLGTLGCIHALIALVAVGGSFWLWRRSHRGGWVREPTWDCGYAAPTARMQYTAGSFSGTITEWFGQVLRPERHAQRPEGVFPQMALVEEHTPETVLERIVEPIARQVLWLSAKARQLQQGRVQAYLLYLLLGVVVLAALTLAWSHPESAAANIPAPGAP